MVFLVFCWILYISVSIFLSISIFNLLPANEGVLVIKGIIPIFLFCLLYYFHRLLILIKVKAFIQEISNNSEIFLYELLRASDQASVPCPIQEYILSKYIEYLHYNFFSTEPIFFKRSNYSWRDTRLYTYTDDLEVFRANKKNKPKRNLKRRKLSIYDMTTMQYFTITFFNFFEVYCSNYNCFQYYYDPIFSPRHPKANNLFRYDPFRDIEDLESSFVQALSDIKICFVELFRQQEIYILFFEERLSSIVIPKSHRRS